MQRFFDTKGTLEVSIGEGYLSSFETGILKPGDVVKTSREAGYPCSVFYNGHVLCQGEIVVPDDVFALRVSSLVRAEPFGPVPGNTDDVVEILPTRVSLGSIRLSLNELKDVSQGTCISLGKPFSAQADAELSAAGIPLARGKVVCI